MNESASKPPGGAAPDSKRYARARLGIPARTGNLARKYAVVGLFLALFIALSLSSDAFLTPTNLFNILNQNAPLAIIACAGTLVIIGGGFDLSTAAIVGVVSVLSAWTAVHFNTWLAIGMAPFIGAALGTLNGVIITTLRIHSFLATLATSLVYRAIAVLVSGGFLIPVVDPSFTILGQGKIGDLYYAVFVFLAWAGLMSFLLLKTPLGRYILAVGGNSEAADLSGISVARIRVATFALSGLASGLAGLISVSRIASGQATAGAGLDLQSIAAVVLGGTSIMGGEGAVWRSVLGVLLLALIANGFNILNADPFYRDLTTGVIIVAAVALSAWDKASRR